MPQSAKAIAWQVYGALVLTAAILGVLIEAIYWVMRLYDPSIVKDSFLIPLEWLGVAHIFSIFALVALIHYGLTVRKRRRALAGIPDAGDVSFNVQVGRFNVQVDAGFVIVLLMLAFLRGGWLRGFAFVISAALAIVAHELGHAYAARSAGRFARIRLHYFGGLTTHYGAQPTRRQHLLISAAGPAVGIVLGSIAFTLTHPITNTLARTIANDFVEVNLGWAALNLVPVLPLDGGRLLEAMLKRPHHATIYSIVFGIIATFVFAMLKMSLTAGMFAVLALSNAISLSPQYRTG